MKQAEFAKVAGVSQATVSKWEKEFCEPSRDNLVAIRNEAMRRGLSLSDAWFFEAETPVNESRP